MPRRVNRQKAVAISREIEAMSTAPCCAPVNGYPRMHVLDDNRILFEPVSWISVLFRSDGDLGHVEIRSDGEQVMSKLVTPTRQ